MRPVITLLAALAIAPGALAAPAPTADREIRALIEFVDGSGCTFVRNGEDHAAPAAAAHLAMKYGKARSRLSTAEQFIEHVATRSYFTGREYRVRCPGVAEQASGAWLRQRLAEERAGPRTAAGTAAPPR